MIEIVNKEEMEKEEVEKEETEKLPKNIRQIGERERNKRIYFEDYVITYLKQICESMKEGQRVFILYGKKEIIDYMPTWFVSGILETETEPFYESNLIDEHDWHRLNGRSAKFFPELSVLGWAVVGQGDITEYMEQIQVTWKQFFRDDQKLFYYFDVTEATEDLYCFENGKLERQHGYYIYYAKNENMQNYMLSARRAKEEEEEEKFRNKTEVGNDHATRRFRSLVQEKKEEIHRKRIMSFLYAASSILVMVIMVIGITMLNNYEKMENMEDTLRQLSGQVKDGFAAKEVTEQAMAMDNGEGSAVKKEADKPEIIDTLEENKANQDEKAADESVDDSKQNGDNQGALQAEGSLPDTGQADVNQTDTAQESSASEIGQAESGEANTGQAESGAANTGQNSGEGTEIGQDDAGPSDGGQQPEEAQSVSAESQYTVYEVKRGDTLAKICIRFYGNEDRIGEICTINHIQNKNKILYGQKILLP